MYCEPWEYPGVVPRITTTVCISQISRLRTISAVDMVAAPKTPRRKSDRMADLSRASAAPAQKGHNEFGALPEWDLTDLYPAPDSAELKRDVQWAKDEAKAFEADYKGKLEVLAKGGKLYEAIERAEKLGDVTGRLGSFAYLRYAQNTQDPERTKFLGDLNQQITDLTTGLLFWELELNAIDDATIEAALGKDANLMRYKHWFAELRKAKP